MVEDMYEQMDIRRRSYAQRRLICVGIVAAAALTGGIVALSNPLIGAVVFIVPTVSLFNYYQDNLSIYFRDPYGYELAVIENSIGTITKAEAQAYAEIVLVRREMVQLKKRNRAISRNNFLFWDKK